jgi:hypothetical protein
LTRHFSANAMDNLTDCSFSRGLHFSSIQKSHSGSSQASQTWDMVSWLRANSRPSSHISFGEYLLQNSVVFMVLLYSSFYCSVFPPLLGLPPSFG